VVVLMHTLEDAPFQNGFKTRIFPQAVKRCATQND
jgi:hypothetical protein